VLEDLPLSSCIPRPTGEWSAALAVQQPSSFASTATLAPQQQQQRRADGADGWLVHGESGKTWTELHNTLGKDADLLLDYGDRQVQCGCGRTGRTCYSGFLPQAK